MRSSLKIRYVNLSHEGDIQIAYCLMTKDTRGHRLS